MIIKKVLYILRRNHFFRKTTLFLEPGKYFFDNESFSKQNKNDRYPFWDKIRIFIRNKSNVGLHASGSCFIGKYKAKLFFEDIIVFYVFNKKRYEITKANYYLFHEKLNYNFVEYYFCDHDKRIITNVIDGVVYNDDAHFQKFLNVIMDQYVLNNVVERKQIDDFTNVPFFVQHGDCKNNNILWKLEEPILIDLEAVDSYPIFYDLFYYVFSTKKTDAPVFLKKIRPVLEKFLVDRGFGGSLDYYLSCYLCYLTKYLSRKYSQSVFGFYFGWINYSDYSEFPILSQKIKFVLNEAKRIGFNV